MNSESNLESIKLDDIEYILSEGADERISLDEDGNTKYSIPLLHRNIINRGSCTCSVATDEEVKCIANALDEITSEDEWIKVIDSLPDKLKSVLAIKNDTEFFFAPSGTDLVYYPLMFARILHPDKKILNITTCIEELGSGTRLAAIAKYYANYNQFGESINKGETIQGFENVSGYFSNARSKDGEILNNREEIISLIQKHPDHAIIVNLVYGSKSGIEDSLALIDEVKGENIFWNTDLCQFRHGSTIINELIESESTVMVTGSKFYQTPPFCAALIAPKALYNKLSNIDDWSSTEAFRRIFSVYDIPQGLRAKVNFREAVNHSLTLRWLCALNEMEKFNALPAKQIDKVIKQWRSEVVAYLDEKEAFEVMPFQDDADKTIISFSVKKGDRYLDYSALKKLHRYTALSNYSFLPDDGKVFIGQPVDYFNGNSFVRLAIGSKNIRKFITDNEQEFEMDKNIVDALNENISKYDEDHTEDS